MHTCICMAESLRCSLETTTTLLNWLYPNRTSQVGLLVKNLPANAGDVRDTGLVPGLGRSPEDGNGNPLQHSCLGNPMDRGAWWAPVHMVAKNQTGLSQLSMTEPPTSPKES